MPAIQHDQLPMQRFFVGDTVWVSHLSSGPPRVSMRRILGANMYTRHGIPYWHYHFSQCGMGAKEADLFRTKAEADAALIVELEGRFKNLVDRAARIKQQLDGLRNTVGFTITEDDFEGRAQLEDSK